MNTEQRARRVGTVEMSALVRLANELHELPANPIRRFEHALRAISELTGAACAAAALLRVGASPARMELLMLVTHGWEDGSAQIAANDYFRTLAPMPPPRPIMIQAALQSARHPFTRSRDELVSDRAWYESDFFQQRCRAMRIDHAIYSMARAQTNLLSGLMLARPWGDRRRFSERETTIVRLFHSQIGWLFRVPTAPPQEVNLSITLSPRQKQTLRLLLRGDGEKQIAGKLLLSRHTVHEHVKAIYRTAGVNSRGELLAKFLNRN